MSHFSTSNIVQITQTVTIKTVISPNIYVISILKPSYVIWLLYIRIYKYKSQSLHTAETHAWYLYTDVQLRPINPVFFKDSLRDELPWKSETSSSCKKERRGCWTSLHTKLE